MKIKNKISFILPVFKTNITQVNECLDSISSQDKNLIEEIILVDDASGEEYRKELKNLISSRQDEGYNIFLVESDSNKGVANSRKIGYEKSNGQIIVFIDSDDILVNKHFCEEICSNFNKNEKLQLIRFKWIKFRNIYNLNKKFKRKKYLEGNSYNFIFNVDFIANSNGWMSVWQYAFRRDVFEKCSELLTNVLNKPFEDIYFSFLLATNEFNALQIDKIQYGYRFPNQNSILWKLVWQNKKNKFYVLENLNVWLTSFDNYNLKNPKIYDMWVMWCITYIPIFGYNKMIKHISNFPNKEEIKNILEKYKFRKNRKIFLFLVHLNLKWKLFDSLIPIAVQSLIFIKQKIFRI